MLKRYCFLVMKELLLKKTKEKCLSVGVERTSYTFVEKAFLSDGLRAGRHE